MHVRRSSAPLAPQAAPAAPHAPARTASTAPANKAARADRFESSLPIPEAGLSRGARGPEVKKLQDALKSLGYMTAAQISTGPGVFGPKTEAAVKKFQADKGLPTTGYYGDLTHAALHKALDGHKPTPPKPGPVTQPPDKPGPGRFTKPPVISAPSPNFNSRGGKDIDTIVLHHTASNNGAGDISWLRNPKSQASAHYVLDRDGKIYQLVGDDKRAWHAGESALHGVRTDVNARSIGIEIVNDGSGKTPFTEAQYKSLTQLVGHLKQKYNVPMNNIVGHKDVAIPRGRKTDPAPNFDWNRLRRGIS